MSSAATNQKAQNQKNNCGGRTRATASTPSTSEQEPAANQEDKRDKATDEEVFLGGEQQRRGHAGGVEPVFLPGSQVAEDANDQQQGEEVDVDIVANEPREVEECWGDHEQQAGGESAEPAKL